MIMDAYFVSGNWSILLIFPCPGKLLLYFETIWAWSWENWDSVQLLVANLVEMCFYSCLSLPEECPAVQQIHHIRWFGLLYHARSWALEPEEVTLLSVSFLSIIRTRKRYHDNGYCLMLNRTIRICNMCWCLLNLSCDSFLDVLFVFNHLDLLVSIIQVGPLT